MPSVKEPLLKLAKQGTLSDYVTVVTWSPDGTIAASSAPGEVMLLQSEETNLLQSANGKSVDCLAFSKDGQFLAAGGQDGGVNIWQLNAGELIASLKNAPAWVDQMAWSPSSNLLAFSLGRFVQVWDADQREIAATLDFAESSVLNINWHPNGQGLTVGGYQGVKIWNPQDWDDDPYMMSVDSASLAIAWSPDGKYLASGNLDRTITVLEWNNPHPWIMRGFPGKIRHLAWSQALTKTGAPLLASASAECIVVWEKHPDVSRAWEGRVIERHTEVVQAITFQPNTFLLASASEDGCVCLWHKAKSIAQNLSGAPDGFSCLAWHPQGHQLAAGGNNGEILIWSPSQRGQGFGRR